MPIFTEFGSLQQNYNIKSPAIQVEKPGAITFEKAGRISVGKAPTYGTEDIMGLMPGDEEGVIEGVREEWEGYKDLTIGEITKAQTTAAGKMVDVDAMVKKLETSYKTVENKVIDASLSQARSQLVELDAYFAGSTSDQRAGARAMFAQSTQESLMRGAYQALGGIYRQNVMDIVGTVVEMGKLNATEYATAASVTASALSNLGSTLVGTYNVINSNYVSRLNAAVKTASMNAQVEVANMQAQTSADIARMKANASMSVAQMGATATQGVGYMQYQTMADIAVIQGETQRDVAEIQAETERSVAETEAKSAIDVAILQPPTAPQKPKKIQPGLTDVSGLGMAGL